MATLLRLLRSSSSSVKVNGEFTNFFFHKRGLRQGDPLSPHLFIIVAEALQSFITNAVPLTSGPIIIPPRALQYANDTNMQQILARQPKELPITYLGLPLSFRRLRKIHFKPLIEAVQRKLDGWRARFLSIGGRQTLVKSVLTAMPLHYMQAIRLPTWLLKHLEGLRRSFFWRGKNKYLGGHCLVNWSKCCLPKKNGGLGFISLDIQNQALLLKWLWKLTAEHNSLWTSTVRELFGTTDFELLATHSHISNGLKDILCNKTFFSSSIITAADQSKAWRWEPNGSFSSSSAYKVLPDTGIRSHFHHKLWKIKAPSKVKIFLWLLLQDRLLTQANLMLRGWPAVQSCTMCPAPDIETTAHLFIHCPFARQLWDRVQLLFNLPVLNFTPNMVNFWLHNRIAIGKQ
ncbi:hypothetical protein LUZ63_005125 [Rhynchospora breviuscula]|uniref:Reverse transcriptase zinc-binding domain-containing protein n=1 Tax=Rhynchospora breviuscula TaxID=2022672 RepID=A0A9Q0HSU1_9POAL|nr:hypothetical protein LUZ63_005125 [Rhynchospora breviuscula]